MKVMQKTGTKATEKWKRNDNISVNALKANGLKFLMKGQEYVFKPCFACTKVTLDPKTQIDR